jgi:hypothetical protein
VRNSSPQSIGHALFPAESEAKALRSANPPDGAAGLRHIGNGITWQPGSHVEPTASICHKPAAEALNFYPQSCSTDRLPIQRFYRETHRIALPGAPV